MTGTAESSLLETQQFWPRRSRRSGRPHLFLPRNATLRSNKNTSFGALTAFDRGHNSEAKDYSLVLGDTYMISPQWVSETRFGFGYHDEGSYPVDPHGPGIDINGFGNFGRDFILPARVVERVYQVRQNFMRISGRQTLKFGADVNPLRDWVRSETFMGGRFVFGEAVPLGSIIDNAAGPGTSQLLKGLLAQAGAGALAGAVELRSRRAGVRPGMPRLASKAR